MTNLLLAASFASVVGAVLGGLACATTIYLARRQQLRTSRMMSDLDRREDIYARFIEQASEMWSEAFETPRDPGNLIGLAALVGRIRMVSTRPVLEAAEAVMTSILEIFQQPPADVRRLAEQAPRAFVAPMTAFTAACRAERERTLCDVLW